MNCSDLKPPSRTGSIKDAHLPSVIARPHLLVPGHQRTVSTNKGCKQWLSLAKTFLKVALVGGNRLLVARTSKCGRAISFGNGRPKAQISLTHPIPSMPTLAMMDEKQKQPGAGRGTCTTY